MKLLFKTFILIIAVIFFAYLLFYFADILLAPNEEITKNQVCYKNSCFLVELAKTAAEREEGLMFRDKLGQDKGMLFVFDKEDIYPFWMKNTLIPLDIIWIDKDWEVVFIEKNSQPCLKEYSCPMIILEAAAKYVLEINAGVAEEIGIKTGDGLDASFYDIIK